MEKQSIFDNVVGEPESFFMTRENDMRFLIAAVFSVALSVSSGVSAQGTQPETTRPQGAQPQAAQPTPGSSFSEYSYAEHGRYHPCPSSVKFSGRNACLGCPTRCPWLPADLTGH